MSFGGANEITGPIDPVTMRAYARVGTVLKGKWRLDALLGVGGMACVFAATHLRNESRAAIKILHPELSSHPDIRARFLREGRAANVVAHRGVVRVLDDDVTDDGAVYLVMELLDGESLEARAARKGGRLPVEEVLGAIDQLLDVLAAAHAKGIVHRDIKPENLFLTRDGQLKVLDFGVARLRELSASSNATKVGSILGTPAYMAPEQARAKWSEVDGRTDLWAVGATMQYLLTGRPVHAAETANEALALAVTRQPMPIKSADPSIPTPVADLIDRALFFDRDARWADALAMQRALRETYERLHAGAPISEATPLLFVPATVPNRTLPSATDAVPMHGGATMSPVSNGVSGVALLRTIARVPRVVVAGFAGLVVVAIVVGVIVAAAARRTTAAASSLGQPPSSIANAATPAPPIRTTGIPSARTQVDVTGLPGTAVPVEQLAPESTTKMRMPRAKATEPELRPNPYVAPRPTATAAKPLAAPLKRSEPTPPNPYASPRGLAEKPE